MPPGPAPPPPRAPRCATPTATYAAATVDLPSLRVSAIGVAVAMAVASGSRGVEAVVVLTAATAVSGTDLAVVRDFAGAGVPLHRADLRGDVAETVST